MRDVLSNDDKECVNWHNDKHAPKGILLIVIWILDLFSCTNGDFYGIYPLFSYLIHTIQKCVYAKNSPRMLAFTVLDIKRVENAFFHSMYIFSVIYTSCY